ncbi:hypothetical protein BGE01nite_16560 [Brevifollis gellanilyticus]|uniref:Uncharacterized protein n=1 Tax=Brevifollis gellanilyticus TaxID=748831 RepID=A0A512M6K2_9BACT|nr:hypothetical protein BGE01nite_16560 [Brevifollis gellanilyticus]
MEVPVAIAKGQNDEDQGDEAGVHDGEGEAYSPRSRKMRKTQDGASLAFLAPDPCPSDWEKGRFRDLRSLP